VSAAIGFDLYTRLLRRAIEELQQSAGERGDPIRRAQDRTAGEALALDLGPSIDLPLSAHLPQEYVPDDPLRLRLYRRLARAHTEADVAALTAELEDRFGPLPAPVANLLYVLRVRVLAADARVTAVRSEGQDIVVQMPETISRSVSQAISAAVADCQARGLHVRLKSSPGWQNTLLKALGMLQPASRA
jgi:transcription-repair coupling factor (superfamily II helicase)